MDDRQQGINSQKFDVKRTDGSSEHGGKHEGCSYWVLDLVHDQFSKPALVAYADACEAEYPLLAKELRELASRLPVAQEVKGRAKLPGTMKSFQKLEGDLILSSDGKVYRRAGEDERPDLTVIEPQDMGLVPLVQLKPIGG